MLKNLITQKNAKVSISAVVLGLLVTLALDLDGCSKDDLLGGIDFSLEKAEEADAGVE